MRGTGFGNAEEPTSADRQSTQASPRGRGSQDAHRERHPELGLTTPAATVLVRGCATHSREFGRSKAPLGVRGTAADDQ